MFLSLTPYLLKFKKVAIPHVGQLELISKPATLDIADRMIYSSVYAATFTQDDTVGSHQLHYMASLSQSEEAIVTEQLNTFGSRLKQKIQQQGFEWKGIGRLEWKDGQGISFQPSTIQPIGLQPVPANKVLRENVQHTILVGEQEVQSQSSIPEQQDEIITTRKGRKTVLIVAGIVIVLAVAFIAYYFYTHGFNPTSTGYQQKVNAAAPQPTYH